MAYEIKLARRAISDLRHIYKTIETETSLAAEVWFRGLESLVFSLETHPARGAVTSERPDLRHLLYGNKPHIYRILYTINENEKVVNITQIRHGARRSLIPISSKP